MKEVLFVSSFSAHRFFLCKVSPLLPRKVRFVGFHMPSFQVSLLPNLQCVLMILHVLQGLPHLFTSIVLRSHDSAVTAAPLDVQSTLDHANAACAKVQLGGCPS